MALPVITNNSPSAGYISWTATNVTWGTYSFAIAAGNTNKLYTWWEFRGGTPAIVSSDTYPASLLPEDLLLFLNKDGVGMLVPDASVMNGALIVPGTIYAYAIHGDEIQGYHIKSNQISTTHLQADSVVADKIASSAITTEKLAAGSVSDDLVANGSFEDLDTVTGLPEGFTYPSLVNGTVTVDQANATSGTQCLKITATTTGANVIARQAPEKYIPVSVASNRKWYVSLRAAAAVSVTTGMVFRVNWYNSSKTFISSTSIVAGPAMDTTWGIYEGQVQPVTNARFMGLEVQVITPNVATSFYFDELTAREVVMTAMIGDGVISTPKLIAGSVSVDKLTAGSVSSNLVANGSFEDYDSALTPLGFTKASEVNGTIQVIQGASTSGAYSTRLNATTTAANLILRQSTDKYIPVSVAANRKWYVSLRAGTDVAVTTGMTFRVNWYDTAKAFISSTTIVANPAMNSTWGVYEGQIQPVTNAKYMALEVQVLNPNVVAQFLIDELTAQEVVVSAMIGDGAIVATKINAGAVTAQAVAAKAIGAQHLMVADLNNYWQIPDFEGLTAGTQPENIVTNTLCRVKDISAWTGPVSPAVVDGTTDGNGSARALEIDALNGSQNDVYDNTIIPVKPGDKFWLHAEGRYLNTAGTTGAGNIGFRTYNNVKSVINNSVVATLGTTKVVKMTPMTGVYEVPAGVYFVQPWVAFTNNGETTNKFVVDNIEYRKQNAGYLLVDGAIDGQTITGAEIKTDPDAETGIYAQMGQFMVNSLTGSDDRPGFGFVNPSSSSPKIGMFSEDGQALTLMGSRAIINGPAESYIILHKYNSDLYNYQAVNITGSTSNVNSMVNIAAGGTVHIDAPVVEVNGKPVNGPWQSMTLAGSWVNYTGGGGYIGGLRARQVGSSVQIQGMVKNGATGTTISTLPSSLWPQFSAIRPCIAAGAAGQLGISNLGVITYLAGTTAPSYVSINEILPL